MAELTQQEVAAMLGITRSAVAMAERKAIRKLRAALDSESSRAGCSPLEWLHGEEERDCVAVVEREAIRLLDIIWDGEFEV